MTTQFQVQFNWQNQGFTEIYYTADNTLVDARASIPALIKARQQLMPKDPTLYIWAVRYTVLGSPPQEDIFRPTELTTGQFSPQTAETAASPWDAWLYYAKAQNGVKKVQEIRTIPKSLTGIFGSTPVPASEWLNALATFRQKITKLGFGIYHSQKPAANVMATVDAITPSTGGLNQPPAGVLIVTSLTRNFITANNSPAKVILSNCRCSPKLAPRHIGVFIDATHFYLKNTDVGTLNYQGGGLYYIYNPTVIGAANVTNIRSAVRKVGKPFGSMKGRRQRLL